MRTRLLIGGIFAGAACLLSVTPASAQTTIKLKAGFNMSRVVFDPTLKSVYVTGFGFDSAKATPVNGVVLGAVFNLPVTTAVHLQVEGLFSQGGAGVEASGSAGQDYTVTRTIKLNSLEIPVLASFPIGSEKKFDVQAGVFLLFKLSQSEHLTEVLDGASVTDIDLADNEQAKIKKTSFGAAFGAHYAITDMIAIGGRFNLGLSDLQDETDPVFKSIKTREISVFALIGFGGK